MAQITENAILTIENGVFHSKEGFVSGTPIFVGTRVPIKNLFDYLAGGHSLDEFLDDFPSVIREQAFRSIRYGDGCLGEYWSSSPFTR